jgi:hypothetical protein
MELGRSWFLVAGVSGHHGRKSLPPGHQIRSWSLPLLLLFHFATSAENCAGRLSQPLRRAVMASHAPPTTRRFGIWPLVWGSLVCCHFGGLLSICSKFSKYIFADSLDLGGGPASGNLLPPLLLRCNDLGGCPCRREDLWPHCGILLTCSGAACFQNMEVRCCTRACQGK